MSPSFKSLFCALLVMPLAFAAPTTTDTTNSQLDVELMQLAVDSRDLKSMTPSLLEKREPSSGELCGWFADSECTCYVWNNKYGAIRCGWALYYPTAGIGGPRKRDSHPLSITDPFFSSALLGGEEPMSIEERVAVLDNAIIAAREETNLCKRDAEIVLRNRYPLLFALGYIGAVNVKNGVRRFILNRFPKDHQDRWVTGLQGVTTTVVKIAGYKYPKGSTWEIRYDFAGWHNMYKGAQVPAQGNWGYHVNFKIQDGPQHTQKYAIYSTSANHPVGVQGANLYNHLLDTLSAWAGYSGIEAALWTENKMLEGAKTVALKWYQGWLNHHEEL
jgi:hypothetical protein